MSFGTLSVPEGVGGHFSSQFLLARAGGSLAEPSMDLFEQTLDVGFPLGPMISPITLEFIVDPSISGSPHVGQVLTANPGVYVGFPGPVTVIFLWTRDLGVHVGTGPTYTVVPADIGHDIDLSVSISAPGQSNVTKQASVSIT